MNSDKKSLRWAVFSRYRVGSGSLASLVFRSHRFYSVKTRLLHVRFTHMAPGRSLRSHSVASTNKIRPSGSSFICWWLRSDLNQRHKALQASALPAELQSHSHHYSTISIFLAIFSHLVLYFVSNMQDSSSHLRKMLHQ